MLKRNTPGWLIGAITAVMLGISGINPAMGVYLVGEHVNNFTLQNWSGQWVSLYDYNDRIVVLAFWFAT